MLLNQVSQALDLHSPFSKGRFFSSCEAYGKHKEEKISFNMIMNANENTKAVVTSDDERENMLVSVFMLIPDQFENFYSKRSKSEAFYVDGQRKRLNPMPGNWEFSKGSSIIHVPILFC